jgi:hypothetical protein
VSFARAATTSSTTGGLLCRLSLHLPACVPACLRACPAGLARICLQRPAHEQQLPSPLPVCPALPYLICTALSCPVLPAVEDDKFWEDVVPLELGDLPALQVGTPACPLAGWPARLREGPCFDTCQADQLLSCIASLLEEACMLPSHSLPRTAPHPCRSLWLCWGIPSAATAWRSARGWSPACR